MLSPSDHFDKRCPTTAYRAPPFYSSNATSEFEGGGYFGGSARANFTEGGGSMTFPSLPYQRIPGGIGSRSESNL